MAQMRTLTINGEKYDIIPVLPADTVTLLASDWVANEDTYYQVVDVPGITVNTKIDLQPTPEQLEEFHYKVLAFVAENDGGTVTVFAVGDKPENDHTIQITKTEVEGVGKIRGNTVGTTMPRPDWNQTDPKMADYILNKPFIPESAADVGARPDTWMPAAEEVGARPDTWMPSASEVGARPDTWLPTLEEIGAAPSGYGLGETASKYINSLEELGSVKIGGNFRYSCVGTTLAGIYFNHASVEIISAGGDCITQIIRPINTTYVIFRTWEGSEWGDWINASPSAFAPSGYGLGDSSKQITDWNEAKLNGWYRDPGNAANSPFPGMFVIGFVTNYQKDCVQNVYTRYSYGTNVKISHKVRMYDADNSSWGEWEWVNPELKAGVEYRTTERWNGKPVYKQAFEFTMPNNTFVRAYPPTDILWAESTIVEFSGVIVSGSNMYTFPATDLSGSTAPFSSIMAYAASGKVCFKCQASGDMSAFTAKIIVSYVKN